MKSNQPNFSPPKDTPATRKRRLQDRLQELNAKGEEEMNTLMQSIEKLKRSLKPSHKSVLSNQAGGNAAPEQD